MGWTVQCSPHLTLASYVYWHACVVYSEKFTRLVKSMAIVFTDFNYSKYMVYIAMQAELIMAIFGPLHSKLTRSNSIMTTAVFFIFQLYVSRRVRPSLRQLYGTPAPKPTDRCENVRPFVTRNFRGFANWMFASVLAKIHMRPIRIRRLAEQTAL